MIHVVIVFLVAASYVCIIIHLLLMGTAPPRTPLPTLVSSAAVARDQSLFVFYTGILTTQIPIPWICPNKLAFSPAPSWMTHIVNIHLEGQLLSISCLCPWESCYYVPRIVQTFYRTAYMPLPLNNCKSLMAFYFFMPRTLLHLTVVSATKQILSGRVFGLSTFGGFLLWFGLLHKLTWRQT